MLSGQNPPSRVGSRVKNPDPVPSLYLTQGWARAQYGMYKAKAKACSGLQGQGQGQGHDFCPRAILQVEESTRGPHPWLVPLLLTTSIVQVEVEEEVY